MATRCSLTLKAPGQWHPAALSPDKRPGYGNPLLLSPGELVSRAASHGLVAIRQAHDEVMNVSLQSHSRHNIYQSAFSNDSFSIIKIRQQTFRGQG